MADDHFLEDVNIYGYPNNNPALAEILLGAPVQAIVAEQTSKVLAVYASRMEGRPRKGDKHPGRSLENTRAEIVIGGYRNDRWVGEITVEVEYAAADEKGRTAFNPYEGHHDLREALHAVLPWKA